MPEPPRRHRCGHDNYTIARREPSASSGTAVPAPGRRLLTPHWTMAARFVTVGVRGYAVNVATFTLIVHPTPGPVGIAKVPAEALATMAMTPLGFTANQLRAFAPEPRIHVCPAGSPDEPR